MFPSLTFTGCLSSSCVCDGLEFQLLNYQLKTFPVFYFFERMNWNEYNRYILINKNSRFIFILILKGGKSSFQSSKLNEKNVCHKMHWSLTKHHFGTLSIGFKRYKSKWNFHYPTMSIMTLQILELMDFIKPQKSDNLEVKQCFFFK